MLAEANAQTTSTQPHMDALSVAGLRARAVEKAESKKHFGLNHPDPFFQRSEEDYDADIRMAGEIDALDLSVRTALMKRLRISRLERMLEPGQQLGNDSLTVPNAEKLTEEETGRIMAVQADFELLDLEEPARHTGFFYGSPRFELDRNGVTQDLIMHENGNLSFSAKFGEDHDSKVWAHTAHICGVSSYEDEPTNERFPEAADFHLGQSIMADEASKIECLAPLHGTFTDFDLAKRTVKVKADKEEVTLDLSGDALVIKDSQRKPLPQMMAAGFMKQYAKSIKFRGGAGALEKDLRKVFDNTAKRLG